MFLSFSCRPSAVACAAENVHKTRNGLNSVVWFKNSVGILAYKPIITKIWVFRFPKKMYHSRLRYLARYSLHYAILESPARSYMKWVRFSFIARNLLLSWDSAAVAFTELWVIHVRKCQKHKHCVRLAAGERNKHYTSSLIQNTINTEAAPGPQFPLFSALYSLVCRNFCTLKTCLCAHEAAIT